MKNWDDYVLRSLHDKSIVSVTTLRQVLHPPSIWLLFPAALSVEFLMTRLAQVLDIDSYQPGANHGELLLQLRSATACQRLYNCTVSCGEYGNASLTSGDIHVDAQWNRKMEIDAEDGLESRLRGLDRGLPTLNRANLLSLGN